MLQVKKLAVLMISVFTLVILGACGFTVEQHEEMGGGDTGNEQGTMPAGQEAPEQEGVLKGIESKDVVVITVDGQDVTYRLSEDAKAQIENEDVKDGDEVTFTTYSIGDDRETIDKFIIK
ncbi:hypothetical protein [Pontibacillus sp. HMF3514]|uniref:hypothetical protein n=1 Tax=Pontibacillus sp. HMF3514 TaxID=2692425 RepID=UPI0013201D82|nr:hypothetical protein [Pontibacillus sp. HMF3514]QHE52806.1 hypothetical protein GS400_12560 [Pontibacillus sp. HMF3514]